MPIIIHQIKSIPDVLVLVKEISMRQKIEMHVEEKTRPLDIFQDRNNSEQIDNDFRVFFELTSAQRNIVEVSQIDNNTYLRGSQYNHSWSMRIIFPRGILRSLSKNERANIVYIELKLIEALSHLEATDILLVDFPKFSPYY